MAMHAGKEISALITPSECFVGALALQSSVFDRSNSGVVHGGVYVRFSS